MARPVLCVVGSGTAGLEALFAARAALGETVGLRLITPEHEFRYRPMSAASLFRPAEERGLPIADVATQAGAEWIQGSAAAVYEDDREVLTRDGDTVKFDFLLLALGSRSRRALRQGYLWERGGDPSFLDRIITGILAGEVRSVAVVAPLGARWPIPAYELALVLAWTAAGTEARVTLITAERQPVAALGGQASDTVTRELREAGVAVISATDPSDEHRSHVTPDEPVRLLLRSGRAMERPGSPATQASESPATPPARGSLVEFDRLISLPAMDGPFLAGVETDVAGFIEVDEGLRVCGSERIWAAGGCIAAALDYSALAAQQADAAISAIASAIGPTGADGAALRSSPAPAPELSGLLLNGQRERWLAENPAGTRQPSTRCLWWPPGRAVGGMLAQRIAAWDPSVHQRLPDQAAGLPIHAPVVLGCSGPSMSVGGEVTAADRTARMHDIEDRQLMAIRRREDSANADLRTLEGRLRTLTARQEQAIDELRRHGYLIHRGAAASPPA